MYVFNVETQPEAPYLQRFTSPVDVVVSRSGSLAVAPLAPAVSFRGEAGLLGRESRLPVLNAVIVGFTILAAFAVVLIFRSDGPAHRDARSAALAAQVE